MSISIVFYFIDSLYFYFSVCVCVCVCQMTTARNVLDMQACVTMCRNAKQRLILLPELPFYEFGNILVSRVV